jgi:ribose 5-phosphate isomerase A
VDKKRTAGEKAAELVENGMTIGLGTGSTVYWAIRKLGERVGEGLRIRGVATSKQTAKLACEMGIALIEPEEVDSLDLTMDGADEVNGRLELIKGGGGALLREKLVAACTKRLVIVVDDSKLVQQLGAFLLPVEIVPFAWQTTVRRIALTGCIPKLRMQGDAPFVSDNGNFIADCDFTRIDNPRAKHTTLKLITGVVETGLFIGMADIVLVGSDHGVRVLTKS